MTRVRRRQSRQLTEDREWAIRRADVLSVWQGDRLLECHEFWRREPGVPAGLPRRPFHHLRHACATLLLESGEELANISKLLGHADLGTTADLYGHLTPRIARQASERMRAILPG